MMSVQLLSIRRLRLGPTENLRIENVHLYRNADAVAFKMVNGCIQQSGKYCFMN